MKRFASNSDLRREIRRKWKARRPAAHKGDFGRVFVIAGSRGLAGAAHLAAVAAMRTGAGLVTLGTPEKIYSVLARREAEVMVRPFPSTREGSLAYRALLPLRRFSRSQDVLAVGPGLSRQPETQKLIRRLLVDTDRPVVVDADGLNALKGHLAVLHALKGRAVLTPHPGEFTRLFGGRLSAKDSTRRKKAVEAARRFGIIMVLKGHHTVVAGPDGVAFLNPTGNPGMASGGMGDVLTGVVAALIGQRLSLWDAARFGVYLHGLAGDLAAEKTGEASLVAGDLLRFLPAAIKKLRGR